MKTAGEIPPRMGPMDPMAKPFARWLPTTNAKIASLASKRGP